MSPKQTGFFSLFGARDERGRDLVQLKALLEGRPKLQHLVFALGLVALAAAPVWSVTRPDRLADTCALEWSGKTQKSKRTTAERRYSFT